MFALTAVKDIPYSADSLYTYRIPDELVPSAKAGLLVKIPFGKRVSTGVILSVSQTTEYDEAKIKPIISLGEDYPDIESLSPDRIALALYIRERYFCTYFDAVSLVLPFGEVRKRKIKRKTTFKDPLNKLVKHDRAEIILNDEQDKAYREIKEKLGSGDAHLLFGITGSGKTLVYIKLIDDVLASGKTALLLVPEIALTYQIVTRLYDCYGSQLAVLHSALTKSERKDTFSLIESGEKKVVVGTRSALFAPMRNLGIIIIDEEQEHTYKSEMTPKYASNEVAAFIAKISKSLLVVASATPSFESYKLAKTGKIGLSEIKHRYNSQPLPKVVLVDMHDEIMAGNKSLCSKLLAEEISVNLQKHEQSILFMNRRGYNTFVGCVKCGTAITCPYCGIAMTYHKNTERVVCHYCGYSSPVPETCPSCGAKTMKYSGAGTQKAEEELKNLFPEARILRMDADTVSEKGSRDEILNAVSNNECDILLGTQMITKGLDFPNVTLVGVLLADTLLFSSDYRAFETTFSMITQVVGRAGRSGKSGRAVIQSFYPEHRVFRYALDQDYEGFYSNETAFRKTMLYPPFCDICRVTFIAKTEEEAFDAAERFEDLLRKKQEQNNLPLRVIPAKSTSVPLVNTLPRVRILIKCLDNAKQRSVLSEAYIEFTKNKDNKNIHTDIDMNPIGTM